MIDLLRAFTRLDTTRIWELLNEVGDKLNEVIGRVNQVPVGQVIELRPWSWTIGPDGTVPGATITLENVKPADRWAITAILDVTPNNLAAFTLYANGSNTGKPQMIAEGSFRRQLMQRWVISGYTGTVKLSMVATSSTGTGGTIDGGQSTFMAERIL